MDWDDSRGNPIPITSLNFRFLSKSKSKKDCFSSIAISIKIVCSSKSRKVEQGVIRFHSITN
jgi:hypothetical protein